jgi:hypothetical protein
MRREFVVWGKVANVAVNTLRVKNGEWHLFGNLSDFYSKLPLPVKFHNKVVEKISGYSGEEMRRLYDKAKTNPQVKGDMLEV